MKEYINKYFKATTFLFSSKIWKCLNNSFFNDATLSLPTASSLFHKLMPFNKMRSQTRFDFLQMRRGFYTTFQYNLHSSISGPTYFFFPFAAPEYPAVSFQKTPRYLFQLGHFSVAMDAIGKIHPTLSLLVFLLGWIHIPNTAKKRNISFTSLRFSGIISSKR